MIYFDKSGPDTTDGWNGLNTKQAEESKKMYGDNSITQTKKKSFFRQFLSNFGDPIIKILLIALALNVLFTFRNFPVRQLLNSFRRMRERLPAESGGKGN